MERKFYIWDNGDMSIGDSGSGYSVKFEIEEFDETVFDEDEQKYMKEEIDNMVIKFLKDKQEYFCEYRANIMTEDEHRKMCEAEREAEKQFEDDLLWMDAHKEE